MIKHNKVTFNKKQWGLVVFMNGNRYENLLFETKYRRDREAEKAMRSKKTNKIETYVFENGKVSGSEITLKYRG